MFRIFFEDKSDICVCVCVCVFSSHSFWTSSPLDVPAGVTQEEGHTRFLIHLLFAVRALIFLARRIRPFLSLVDREVERVITYSKSLDRPGKVANPACSWSAEQGEKINKCPPLRLRIWSRETGTAVPSHVSLLILHIQAESGAYSRDPPDFRGRVHLFMSPTAIESVPSLSGHAIAYRWRSLPSVRRHRASSPQCYSSSGCSFSCITMDHLICASLFPYPLN